MIINDIFGNPKYSISFIPDLSKVTEEQMRRLNVWVEALKSDKYKQTICQLKKNSENGECGYCCLGVAAELSGIGTWDNDGGYTVQVGGKVDYDDVTLPVIVQEYYGLESVAGFSVIAEDVKNDLVKGLTSLDILNDNGIPFSEIAKLIESALNGGIREAQQ